MISIKNLNKAKVLKALYDASHIQGMGFLQAVPSDYVTVEHCQSLLDQGYYYFDYLYGKVIKVNLSGDEFDERLYDRDNGPGAAQRAIDKLRRVFGELRIDTTRLNIKVDVSPIMTPDITIRFGNTESVDAMIRMMEDLKEKMEAEV